MLSASIKLERNDEFLQIDIQVYRREVQTRLLDFLSFQIEQIARKDDEVVCAFQSGLHILLAARGQFFITRNFFKRRLNES